MAEETDLCIECPVAVGKGDDANYRRLKSHERSLLPLLNLNGFEF